MAQLHSPVEYFAKLLEERERMQILLPGDSELTKAVLDREIARVRHMAYGGGFSTGVTMMLPVARGQSAVIQQEIPLPGLVHYEPRKLQHFLTVTELFIDKLMLFTGCTIKILELGCGGPAKKPEFVVKLRCMDSANRARVRLDVATEYVESYMERLHLL